MKNIFNFKLSILIVIIAVFSYNYLFSQEISYGDSLSLWSGTIKSWVKTDSSNNPQTVGFTFTEDVLKNLPTQSTITNWFDFPKNASDTLFNHMQFIWLPNGHNLNGDIYAKPHFTDHIFIISKQEQEAITGTDTYQVDPQFVPPGYESSGYNVQYAGVHWFDTTGAEYHSEVFTKTLIYGYSKGKISFYEIAASKAYLETHPHFTGIIKQPEKFHSKGYYPTAYKIDYDSVNHVFNYGLTDFVLRQAAITGVEDSQNKNIPEKLALYQNYPNPFNPSTTIKYSIPEANFVTLKIYDILGREITTLVNKEQKGGVYKVQFNSNNLSSGVYSYRITATPVGGQAGNFVSTKKLMILK